MEASHLDTTRLPQVALECLHQDHLDVVDMLNQLLADLDTDSCHENLSAQLTALAEHCTKHFCCEEKQMAAFNYPDLDAHKAEHERMVAEVTAVVMQWQAKHDPLALKRYLADSFVPWLLDHIQRFDLEGTQFIYDAGGR